jgi:lipopolysaccharide export system permease protein
MGILHRHLFASVAGACAAAVGFFTFVMLTGQVLRELLGFFIAGQIGLGDAAWQMALLLPYSAMYALPIGLLTAVLLVLGRMSSQQEITAMRAAGLSLGYIVRPIWVIATCAVLLSLVLNLHLMPLARSAQRAAMDEALQSNPLKLLVPKTFVRDPKGRFVVYAGRREGAELRDFWLWRLDAQKRVLSVLRAESGTAAFRDEDDRLVLTLNNVSVETRDRKRPEDFSKPPIVATSESASVELSPDTFGAPIQRKVKLNWMTFGQLSARRAELKAKGAAATTNERRELTAVTVTMSEKAAASFGVLALAFVAVPLGIKVSRKETSANLGIAVALVLGYYFLATITGLLERNPALRPEIWVWAPPFVYAVAGVWLFRRVDRA